MSLIGLLLSRRPLLIKHKSGVYLASFLSYCALGSVLFVIFEGAAYVKSQHDVLDAKERVLKKFKNISGEALDAFIGELRVVGIRGLPNKDGTVSEWRYSDSTFFVTTLLTTVGYGHYAPRTLLGKIICIIYTAVGIPITLMYLAHYVEMLLKASESYKAFLFRKFQHKFEPFFLRLVHVSSLMTCIVLSCFIVPALIFIRFEKGWSFIEGIYFCFISLTTVGLGDMVPTLNPEGVNSDLYKFCASLYLIVGVTIIMFMMAMCGDFHRNYKNGYDILPFTISTEKVQINRGSVHSYGSVITQSGSSETSEKK